VREYVGARIMHYHVCPSCAERRRTLFAYIEPAPNRRERRAYQQRRKRDLRHDLKWLVGDRRKQTRVA